MVRNRQYRFLKQEVIQIEDFVLFALHVEVNQSGESGLIDVLVDGQTGGQSNRRVRID